MPRQRHVHRPRAERDPATGEQRADQRGQREQRQRRPAADRERALRGRRQHQQQDRTNGDRLRAPGGAAGRPGAMAVLGRDGSRCVAGLGRVSWDPAWCDAWWASFWSLVPGPGSYRRLPRPAGPGVQATDPSASSPAGVVYSIPLDSARQDASPHGHGGPGSSGPAAAGRRRGRRFRRRQHRWSGGATGSGGAYRSGAAAGRLDLGRERRGAARLRERPAGSASPLSGEAARRCSCPAASPDRSSTRPTASAPPPTSPASTPRPPPASARCRATPARRPCWRSCWRSWCWRSAAYTGVARLARASRAQPGPSRPAPRRGPVSRACSTASRSAPATAQLAAGHAAPGPSPRRERLTRHLGHAAGSSGATHQPIP